MMFLDGVLSCQLPLHSLLLFVTCLKTLLCYASPVWGKHTIKHLDLSACVNVNPVLTGQKKWALHIHCIYICFNSGIPAVNGLASFDKSPSLNTGLTEC